MPISFESENYLYFSMVNGECLKKEYELPSYRESLNFISLHRMLLLLLCSKIAFTVALNSMIQKDIDYLQNT